MRETLYSEESLRRFLLGELPDAEQMALETEFFADRELFEQVCEAEKDLVDDYVLGNLSGEDRARFEQHYFATPERRRQVEFARAMMRSQARPMAVKASASAHRSSGLTDWRRSLRAPTLALGLSFALAASCLWLVLNTARLRRELGQTQTERTTLQQHERQLESRIVMQRAQSEQLARELENVREQLRIAETQQNAPRLATFLLASVGREESKQRTLRITAATDLVQLQIKLKSRDYSSYQATLRTVEGQSVWSRKPVKARLTQTGAAVVLPIPAKRLPSGDYILTLSGISATGEAEDVSNSYFRVDKR